MHDEALPSRTIQQLYLTCKMVRLEAPVLPMGIVNAIKLHGEVTLDEHLRGVSREGFGRKGGHKWTA